MDCGTITPEEAEHHPQKNIITRALGVDYRLDPEFTSVPVQRGDMLLLCTDGLTNVLPKEKIEEIFTKGGFYDIPDRLVDAANAGADAVACAAVLHYKKETVQELKDDIRAGGVEVRRV